jgi:hypothetical protein
MDRSDSLMRLGGEGQSRGNLSSGIRIQVLVTNGGRAICHLAMCFGAPRFYSYPKGPDQDSCIAEAFLSVSKITP